MRSRAPSAAGLLQTSSKRHLSLHPRPHRTQNWRGVICSLETTDSRISKTTEVCRMAHLQPGPAGQHLGSLGLACAILVETAQSNNQTP